LQAKVFYPALPFAPFDQKVIFDQVVKIAAICPIYDKGSEVAAKTSCLQVT
jgi:hypothetical protein